MRIANRNGGEYVLRLEIFSGSHTFSEEKNGVYAVYSYGYHFPMYAYINNRWFGNSDKYSVSTSRHQNQFRPNTKIRYINTDSLKKLINNPKDTEYVEFYEKLGVPL